MSKWTLEKIKNCEEIKEGVRFSYKNYHTNCLILEKQERGFTFFHKREAGSIIDGYRDLQSWADFKFYRQMAARYCRRRMRLDQ